MDKFIRLLSPAKYKLFDAVKNDNYGEVLELTKSGKITSKNINGKDKDGRTALMLAAKKKTKLILEKIISVMSIDPSKLSNLINEKDNDGKTALFYAANPETVKLLLDNKANINAEDKNGQTALMWAAEKGLDKIVELLIKNGADINAKDNNGNTALFYTSNAEIVELLIKKGADVTIQNKKDKATALMVAAGKGLNNIIKPLIKPLIEKGKVDDQDILGETALMWAARNGHTETVKLLVEIGDANVNHVSNYGMTALMLAAEKGHIETVKKLIEKGAVVNIENNDGNTALMLAAANGHIETVKKLIEKGANVNIENKDRNTALIIVIIAEKGHIEIDKVLEIVEVLIAAGADVDAKDRMNNTALMYAAGVGHTEIVKLLIEKGADVTIKNIYGNTALYFAEIAKQDDDIKKLLTPKLVENLKGVTIVEGGAIKDEDCPICIDPLKDEDGPVVKHGPVVKTTTCNHQFHASCLIEQKKINRICPLCRKKDAFFGQSRSSKRKSKKRRSMRRRSKRRSKFSASRQMDLRCPNRVRRRSRSKKLKNKNVVNK